MPVPPQENQPGFFGKGSEEIIQQPADFLALQFPLMAGIREKIEDNDIPESFKGTPIVLLTACLMAIAFFGFSGLK